jgi:glycosyltransferase involved in cell wall biosynthesis/SAM-dependent methyltransferase
MNSRHLLVISHDVVDKQMAGPGIRYWEMARALSAHLALTLATPGAILPGEGFGSCRYTMGDWETLVPAVSKADVLLFSGDLLVPFPQLAACGRPLIIEATSPYTFESLHLNRHLSREQQQTRFRARLETMRRAAFSGDFFFCASERQRDYWVGVLDACGRINPDTYGIDNSLRQMIDVVPFGLPSRRPQRTAPAMKGVIPGISPADRVILWGGGPWQWLDPLTLVRAVAHVAETRPDVRLVFPGTRHPNPTMPDMPMHHQIIELSDRLNLTGKVVFFGDWVPYELWPNYLLDADIGASLHFDSLETRFAFRTRILDYIWAGLPMVVTGGDSTSDLVTRYGLGEVVPPGDVELVGAALGCLLDTPDLRQAFRHTFEQVRPQFTWERVCEPIVRFCQDPVVLAPDRAAGAIPAGWAESTALDARDREIARLQNLVEADERGGFARLSRWVREAWHRALGSRYIRLGLDRIHTEGFYRRLVRDVGRASDHAFVDRAYWCVLRRVPDRDGFEHFRDLLSRGRLSRRGVVADLVRSPEFRSGCQRELDPAEAIHVARRQLVTRLPAAGHVLDLGGASPYSIQGSLFVMGYPHPVQSLTVVDLPPDERQGEYFCSDLEKPGEWLDTEMGPVRYLYTSMADLSAVESNSIDLVLASQGIEHVGKAEGLQVMREVFRVLRAGGRFSLDTPNAALARLQSPSGFLHQEHQVEYHVDELVARLRQVGFEIVEAGGICPMPRTIQSGVFDEQELLANAHRTGDAATCYLCYVHCTKPADEQDVIMLEG